MTDLTKEELEHLTELLFQQMTDSRDFRIGIAIGLAGTFTRDEYERYLEEE